MFLTTDPIRRALDHIHVHYESHLSVEELAEVAGLSPFHFVRRFHAETGLPPHAYLIRFRIEKAKELLLASYPIAEVAMRVGFWDQSHLSHHFKAIVGTSPGRFVRCLAAG